MIPTLWAHGNRLYQDEGYDRVWAVCVELSLPVQTHAGAAPQEGLAPHLGLYATGVSTNASTARSWRAPVST
jgi:predicted TIM-barrel fold metal-dependent hydrolase